MSKTFTEHDAERIIDTHELQAQLEKQFLDSTMYLFDWKDCECLMNGPLEPTKYAENLTLEEAVELIEAGWTPLPF